MGGPAEASEWSDLPQPDRVTTRRQRLNPQKRKRFIGTGNEGKGESKVHKCKSDVYVYSSLYRQKILGIGKQKGNHPPVKFYK
jgi:hypothetical protein